VADELDVDGPGAPPRDNGELVFAEPWQSRAFGVTVGLHEAGLFAWDDFRRELIDQLDGGDAPPDEYWAAWLRATETVVLGRGLVPPERYGERLERYRRRPADHDHDHHHDDHDHDHDHDRP
jgi:nitrile hydratase accessory protein